MSDVAGGGASARASPFRRQTPGQFLGSLAGARAAVDSLVESGRVSPQVAAAAADEVLELHRHGMTSEDLMMADHLVRSDPGGALDRWSLWMDDARGNGSEQLTVRLAATTAGAGAMIGIALAGTTDLLPAQLAQLAISVAGVVAAAVFSLGGVLTFYQRRENSLLRFRRQLGCEYIEEFQRPRP